MDPTEPVGSHDADADLLRVDRQGERDCRPDSPDGGWSRAIAEDPLVGPSFGKYGCPAIAVRFVRSARLRANRVVERARR